MRVSLLRLGGKKWIRRERSKEIRKRRGDKIVISSNGIDFLTVGERANKLQAKVLAAMKEVEQSNYAIH